MSRLSNYPINCLLSRFLLPNDTLNRYLCVGALCLTLLSFVATAADPTAAHNHFRTADEHTQSPRQLQIDDPLTAHPATRYAVRGVILMDDKAIAAVYTPQNTWHKVQVHSQLGQEQAVIRQITIQGIQIDLQGTLLWLPLTQ